MLKLIPLAIVLGSTIIPSDLAAGQRPGAKSQSAKTVKRPVSLDTVLSCADDPLIQETFKTARSVARWDLSIGRLQMMRAKVFEPSTDYLILLNKGFVFSVLNDEDVGLVQIDPVSYLSIKGSQLTFCRDFPIAHYATKDRDATPEIVTMPGTDWLLEPNEVFAHADQFLFHSGVFSNSSDVYLLATKGRVNIEFVCTAKGLHLEKVYLTPKE